VHDYGFYGSNAAAAQAKMVDMKEGARSIITNKGSTNEGNNMSLHTEKNINSEIKRDEPEQITTITGEGTTRNNNNCHGCSPQSSVDRCSASEKSINL